MRHIPSLGVIAFLLLACRAPAEIVEFYADKLDLSDGGMQPPAGVVVVDVFVAVSAGPPPGFDQWTAGAVRGLALGGATFRYATDPNTQMVILTNPGTANRFVTFFTKPRGRDNNNRYTNGGAAAAGRYCPTGPVPTSTPTEVNVAYFASPPETNWLPISGYVFRVALDITQTGHTANEFVVFRVGEEPPGALPYFLSDCAGTDPGTAGATFDVPTITGFDWGLYIPEPASGALLAAGALLVLRRRGAEQNGWGEQDMQKART